MAGVPSPNELYALSIARKPLVFTLSPCYVKEMTHRDPIDMVPINSLLNHVGIAHVDLVLNYQDGTRVELKLHGTGMKLEEHLTGQETDATVANVANPALMPHLKGETP
jgi:hypothetical protein